MVSLKHELNNTLDFGRAKIDRAMLQKFSTRQLDINKTTNNLMLALSPYIDLDNRVVVDFTKIRRELKVQKKTFDASIREALSKKLLFKKDGYFYSNYHLQTSGEGGVMTYVKNYDVFTSAEYLNYTKNEQRLFNFILTRSNRPLQWQTYNIVDLFLNKQKQAKRGLDIFPTFRQLGNALITLIKNGHIEVNLLDQSNGNNTYFLTKETKAIHAKFFGFFGMVEKQEQGLKKIKRLSKENIDNQLIRVRLTRLVTDNIRTLEASERELDTIARANFFMANDINSTQRNFIIGYKNKLFEVAGETGLEIYRKTLRRFLEVSSNSVIDYANEGKAANHFMNFYILPEIRNILVGAALHQNILQSSGEPKFKELLCGGYILPTKHIPSLILFYTRYGSDNHLMDMDRALFQHAIDYTQFKLGNTEWNVLANRTKTVLTENAIYFPELYKDKENFRKLIHLCAREGILLDLEKIKKLSQISKRLPLKESENKLIKAQLNLNKALINNELIQLDDASVQDIPKNEPNKHHLMQLLSQFIEKGREETF